MKVWQTLYFKKLFNKLLYPFFVGAKLWLFIFATLKFGTEISLIYEGKRMNTPGLGLDGAQSNCPNRIKFIRLREIFFPLKIGRS